ncbi:Phage protein [Labilithrix luteola]|uniref:Phage protein n=1 Tax=Labilithrix luteola TaxID=1391654 RepID=A0A0K1PZ26_9BACT|nr:right-handed parallel beta-helix repeat-containing protein [Labilithrix luteola]AKU98780.1 Phage protein [Labilithrix luteola]
MSGGARSVAFRESFPLLAMFASGVVAVVACGSDLSVIGRNVTGADGGLSPNELDAGAIDGAGGGDGGGDGGGGDPGVHGDDVDAGVVLQGGCAPASFATVIDAKSEGAVGDGVTDDTVAIQNAITKVVGTGGAVTIPDGTYLVAPPSQGGQALTIASGMTLKLSSGAVLKAKPGGPESAALIAIRGPNVNVVGGTIAGDRASHTGTGDVGVGISIIGSANVSLDGVTIEGFWSDGVAIRGASNITLCGVLAQHNRRRGVGIESVEGFTATNSSFSNTYGAAPAAGLSIEAVAGDTVHNVSVRGSGAAGNSGGGIVISTIPDPTSKAFEMTFSDARVVANQGNGFTLVGATAVKILASQIRDNRGDGIAFDDRATSNLANGNTITGNGGVPIRDPSGANETSNNSF